MITRALSMAILDMTVECLFTVDPQIPSAMMYLDVCPPFKDHVQKRGLSSTLPPYLLEFLLINGGDAITEYHYQVLVVIFLS